MLAAAFLSIFSAFGQSHDEASAVSPTLSDVELIRFAKGEPNFSSAAFDLVQSRICAYAEGAATSYGHLTPSDLRLPRTTIPPRASALANALAAARLYLDYTVPAEATQGEKAVTWNEIGYVAIERASAVLHHYYLAPEYRNGHEASLQSLRQATRELADYLSKRADSSLAERLQFTKARYAALWFEKCEEVLPVYARLIGSGARGGVRDLLVLRPDLPLIAGWTWDQRKRADTVHKQFVEELSASTNTTVRIEGLLLALARARTDKAFSVAFTNALELIDREAQRESTRTPYSQLLRDILDDRHSRTLLDKTRNDLRLIYEARFLPAHERSTNTASSLAQADVATSTNTVENAKSEDSTNRSSLLAAVTRGKLGGNKQAPPSAAKVKIPPRSQPPLSWQVLHSAADIKYWEDMPLIETRGLAAEGDVVANYYLYLKLRNSETLEEIREANIALQKAFKAGFPQAQLAYANRESDAEERFFWTKKAATTGYPAAQLALGELHILGHGTPMDLERGLGLVRAAYDLKVPNAEVVLAELYASGVGMPRNSAEKPAALYMASAHDNHPKAMIELHERYLSGFLVVRDQLEASRWLVNAALHDKAVLGRYLDEDGKARPQPSRELDSFAKTLAVYGQAIIHKQPEAIKHVAEWYDHGSVGRKSPVRAYALASLIADQNKMPKEFVERLRASLTPQELRTAESLVSQWQTVSPDLM